MGIKQESINTLHRDYSKRVVLDADLAVAESKKLTRGITLNRQIVSDLEFGVGGRPSLPSCFDDEAFVNSGQIDRFADIRRSSWDDLAEACNPVNVSPKAEEAPASTEPSSEPTNVE